ncbi:MAG: RHS repeat-associated core domain-containing protein, partial [Eubacteriaceae bacterium]|nr:RHS repeat-associated core domain-containing protein [Eubacteriaceae bacterium]
YDNVLQMTDGKGLQSFIRDDEGLLFGMESAGKNRETAGSIFLQDELGTTVRNMDPAGGVKDVFAYDEFGNDIPGVKNRVGSVVPFGFTGYMKDGVTDMYFAQAREYMAGAGRFASKDTDGFLEIENVKSINQYAYCDMDPIDFVDPSGFAKVTVNVPTPGEYFGKPENQKELLIGGSDIANQGIGKYRINKAQKMPKYRIVKEFDGHNAVPNEARIKGINRATGTMGTVGKVVKVGGYATAAIDVGAGVYTNYTNGSSTRKIIGDAAVDTGFNLAAIGAGALLGSAFGPVGTVVGAVGVGILGNYIKIDGVPLTDWLKKKVTSLE